MKKLIPLILISLLFACQQDDLSGPMIPDSMNQDDLAFQQNFGLTTTANFIGRVVNADGNQIAGVQITIGNDMSLTDHNGVFVMNNVSVFEKFAHVKAIKQGYLPGSRSLVPVIDGSNDVRIVLLEKNVVATVDSGTGELVSYDGTSVYLPGDFTDSSGNPYSGQVEVSMHYLAPNQNSTFEQMPGSLFGQELDNDAVMLETYGMLGIDLFSPSGERLNIDENSPATLEFPIDTSQSAIAPDTMNLWYFDEEQGYWKEQGQATKVGSKYQAEVSHFSWWNCDLPLRYVNVCFSLNSENGDLPFNYIEIIRIETGQTIFSGQSNADGQNCGLFPADEQVTVNVYSEQCQNGLIHQELVGPFSSDANFTVDINLDDSFQQTTLTATVNNCDGEPVLNGYAFIFFSFSNVQSSPIIVPIMNGNFSYEMSYCPDEDLTFNIIIYDLDANQNTGLIYGQNIVDNNIDLGILDTCIQGGVPYEGNAIFHNQAQVEAFGLLGYSVINGSVLFESPDFAPPAYFDLTPMQSLREITGVLILNTTYGGTLYSLNGLNNLERVGGYLNIDGTQIESMIELTSLNSLGGLYLYSNSNLTTLNGLQSLNEVSGAIRIGSFSNGNSQLSDYCALQTLFTNGIYDEVIINYNAYNPTVQDIIDGNCSQ